MKKLIYTAIVFLLGFFIGNYNVLIKQANASYCNCDESDFSFFSYNIVDFESAVEDIIEDCSIDSYGDISCW